MSFFIPMFFDYAILMSDPKNEFASIEREVSAGWMVRYLLESAPWIWGIIYFWSCWLIIWYFFKIDKSKG